MDHKALHNSGVAIFNARPPTPEETIIIFGVPRSGTSMVAAMLSACGIFLGDTADKAVFEDVTLANAMESRNEAAMKAIIAANNEAHKTWAYKRPLAFYHMTERLALFRNPRFIATFRDPIAISKRNEASMGIRVSDYLGEAIRLTGDLINFARTTPAPILLASYEKAIFEPHRFARSVADFTGIHISPEIMTAAVETIRNGPETYLLASQTTLNKRASR